MSRSLWFVAGAGAGVYAAARARRAAEALTVDGLRDRVGAAVVGLRLFRDEVAQGRVEAETDLRERMGLALHTEPGRELGPGTPPSTRPTTDEPTREQDDS